MNRAIAGHPLVGTEHTFRPDLPPYDKAQDTEGGTLVAGHGHTLVVRAVFKDWNDIEDLTILGVYVKETGMTTHFSPREINPDNPVEVI